MADDMGFSLKRFTALAVDLYGKSEEESEEVARAHGIPDGRLQELIAAWTERLRNPITVFRYHRLYQRALRERGVRRPEVSLEQYVELLKAAKGGDIAEVCKKHGMTVQQWAMVSQHMGMRMLTRPSLAKRFAELMHEGHAHPHPGETPFDIIS
jgi:hypothetical protein